MIRVLIVDDQSLVRAGFRMILEAEEDVEVVGEAADGGEAIAAAGELAPDVILMDVRMPNVDGLEATRRLLDGKDAGPRILILTTFDLDEYVYEALRVGASGFLLKDTPPTEILAAVRKVAAGESMLSPTVLARLIDRVVRSSDDRAVRARSALDRLSPREREVAHAVAAGKSNVEIAGELFMSPATVKAYVSRLLDKLECANRVQVAILVHEASE